MFGKMIAFRVLKRTNLKATNKFCRELYGYTDHSNNNRHIYQREGLLDRIPHVRLIRGVVLIRKTDLNVLIEFLEKYGAEYHVRDVLLTNNDQRLLTLS